MFTSHVWGPTLSPSPHLSFSSLLSGLADFKFVVARILENVACALHVTASLGMFGLGFVRGCYFDLHIGSHILDNLVCFHYSGLHLICHLLA